jgi:hypothetical protein
MIDKVFTYLALAENRQFFAVLTPYMLLKCTQNVYTVCPSDIVLRNAWGAELFNYIIFGKDGYCTQKVQTTCFE